MTAAELVDLPADGPLIAVDIGDKRIGLALSDPTQVLAHPLATLTRRTGRRFPLKQLRAYLESHHPVGVVVGLPLTPAGDEDARAQEARTTGQMIADKSGLPVAFVDERMSTARALRAVADLGGGTRGRKGDIDQLAATVILQQFLDRRMA